MLLHTVDIKAENEVDDWIDAVVGEFGRLDGAANVVGINRRTRQQNTGNIVSIPNAGNTPPQNH